MARPSSARRARLTSLEDERLRDDAYRSGALLPRELGDDRRGARASTAAHACRHEHHVGARERLLQARHVLERGLTTSLRIGAGTETLRDAPSDGDLHWGEVRVEGLSVGVHRNELHTLEPEVDHRVHGVPSGTSAPDDLDSSLVTCHLVSKLDRETHVRPPSACPKSAFDAGTRRAATPRFRARIEKTVQLNRRHPSPFRSLREFRNSSKRCLKPSPKPAAPRGICFDRQR